MSRTGDELRELRDDKLDAVTGELVVLAIIQPLIRFLPPVEPRPTPNGPGPV